MAELTLQQLPQLEAMAERLYNSQVKSVIEPSSSMAIFGNQFHLVPFLTSQSCIRIHIVIPEGSLIIFDPLCTFQIPDERSQAEQALKIFGMSPDYVSHCKVNHMQSMRATLVLSLENPASSMC